MLPSTEGPAEFGRAGSTALGTDGEVLVSDVRGELTPAQVVQQKLMTLLWGDATTVPAAGAVDDIRRVRA